MKKRTQMFLFYIFIRIGFFVAMTLAVAYMPTYVGKLLNGNLWAKTDDPTILWIQGMFSLLVAVGVITLFSALTYVFVLSCWDKAKSFKDEEPIKKNKYLIFKDEYQKMKKAP